MLIQGWCVKRVRWYVPVKLPHPLQHACGGCCCCWCTDIRFRTSTEHWVTETKDERERIGAGLGARAPRSVLPSVFCVWYLAVICFFRDCRFGRLLLLSSCCIVACVLTAFVRDTSHPILPILLRTKTTSNWPRRTVVGMTRRGRKESRGASFRRYMHLKDMLSSQWCELG